MLPLDLTAVAIAFLGNMFLSLFTFAKNPKSATNRLFFLFTVLITSYLIINYIFTHTSSDEAAVFWAKNVMSVALGINLSFFLLSHTFPNHKFLLRKRYFYIGIIITILLVIGAQMGLIFTSVKAYAASGVPGPEMPLFLMHTILFLGGGFYFLIRKFRKSSGIEKIQIKLFLAGAGFMFLSILVTNLLFVLIFNTGAFVPLLPIYTLIFVSFISYAIVKHRFLDINLLVARSVAYILIILLVGCIYTALVFLSSYLFFGGTVNAKEAAIFAILALFIALTFQRIRNIVERITDKFLFKNAYSVDDVLSQITKIMAMTLRLEDLTSLSLTELLTKMRITHGAFITFDGEGIYPPVQRGDRNIDIDNIDVLKSLCALRKLINYEEEDTYQKEYMRDHYITIVVPLFLGDQNLGLLLLGEKKSGEIYSTKDLSVLRILGPEISVGVQNTRSYEEIKRFNITLEEEVKKATSELEVANDKLKVLDKLKDDFVGMASHELRTPMTAIKSYLWMALNKRKAELSADLQRYLDNAYTATDRLINLVNDMLNVSRIESGKIGLKLAEVDIVDLSREVLNEVKPKADEKSLTLSVKAIGLPKIFCDKDKIHEILLNLIGNSLKFTNEKGTIIVSFAQNGDFITTTVSDNGRGLSAQDLPKLFSKFGQLGDSYVRMSPSGGTGLGLYISKLLINVHKGTIEAKSEGLDKGAQFSFSLPIVGSAVAKQLAQEAPKETEESKPLEKTTVLLN